jgi:hypothetical protein
LLINKELLAIYMTIINITMTPTIVILLTIFSACSYSSLHMTNLLFQETIAQGQQQQQPPVANAGPDQRVSEGDTVILNGTGSYDADGTIVSYQWTIEDSDDEDPNPILNDTDKSIATFIAPELNTPPGSYGYSLDVLDNEGLTSHDFVVIVVNKRNMNISSPSNSADNNSLN